MPPERPAVGRRNEEGITRERLRCHGSGRRADAATLLFGLPPERRRRGDDHRQPQPAGIQWIQGRCAAGSTIFGAEIQEIRALIEAGDLASGAGAAATYDVVTPYVDEIAAQFQPPKRVKVVLDAGNGTAGPAMHRVLERVCPGAVELFFEMDGNFPNHHPDPTVPENLTQLRDAVLEHKADLGIAFDGDADRIGAIDDNGEVVWGDQLDARSTRARS